VSKNRKKASQLKGGRAAENTRLKDKKKFKKSSQAWLERQINDPYVKQAKADGYRSRAAYKIAEMDEIANLFMQGMRIVDLGAAPGSWCQYIVKILKGQASIVGVDLLPIKPIEHCTFIEGDFTDDEVLEQMLIAMGRSKVDVVISDMAPNSTGHAKTDNIQIMYMLELALHFAIHNLKTNGSFVCKVLRGGSEKDLLETTKKHFHKIKHFKPKASRADSKEMYMIATGFKGNVDEY
jgi:23S rRNA (uridine2552-2'-O)-methyltransferase